jgi:hypothetical protein
MIGVILALVIVGVILYLVETYIPMDAAIKMVIRIVIVICFIYWLIGVFGLVDIPVPRITR